MRWCGAGNGTNVMIAIQLNRPTSNAVSEMKSALAAAIRPSFSPRPRVGAIAKYWKMKVSRLVSATWLMSAPAAPSTMGEMR